MTLDEYLAKHKQEKMICNNGLQVKDIDSEERSVTAVISTDVVDRDNEVLVPKGADIESFTKNPVIPWSHNTLEPPIGKALWIKKNRNRLTAKVKFAATQKAEEVWQLFKQGFLKAFSVGFIPKEGHEPTPDEVRKKPEWANARFIFDKWELLEFSPVTVPANPEALATAVKSADITLSDELKEELKIEDEEVFTMTSDSEEKQETDEKDVVLKPYPNEHACRLNSPDKYDKFRRAACAQKHDNKCIDVIYGIKAGKSEIQSLRFKKDIWTESDARNVCKARKGKFEAAKSILPDVEIKPNQPDIKTLPSIDYISKENYRIIKSSKKFKGKMY